MKELTIPQALTDAFITELNPKSDLQPNANLEGGEYIKTPDGSILEVWGNKHKNGGVNLLLPNMTAVLSDTKDLTLNKKEVKKLQDDYGMKGLTTKNTYSDVLDRYSRQIKRTKTVNELEDYFEQMKKQIDKTENEGTKNINMSFLTQKVDELTRKKQDQDVLMTNMFNEMFMSQQKQKPTPEVSEDYAPQVTEEQLEVPMPAVSGADSLTALESFELGGFVGNIKNLSEKYGWSERKVYDHLKNKDMLPKYQGGGITVDYGQQAFQGAPTELQKANANAYGKVSAEQAIKDLYLQFPTILSNSKYKDLIDFKDGMPVIKAGVTTNKKNALIGQLQEDMGKQMKSSAERIVNDKSGVFSSEQIQTAQKYLEEETFVPSGTRSSRAIDQMLGNFTSSRTSLGLNLVSPEELVKLQGQGIYSLKQIKNSPEVFNNLSLESQANINRIADGTIPEEVDYRISSYTPSAIAQASTPQTPAEEITEETEVIDDGFGNTRVVPKLPKVDYSVREVAPKLFQSPEQSVPLPTALAPESLEQIGLSRLDPTRMGIENVLSSINAEREFVSSKLGDLPPSQRNAMLSNLTAISQKQESDAILKITQANAQNLASVEEYNAGQADKETIANAQQRLNYEARALSGLSKAEQEMANYQIANNNLNMANAQNQLNLNRIDRMTPDISVDRFGIAGYYDPSQPFQLREPNVELMKVMQMFAQTYTPPTTTKK